jgi:hypothetical protein
MLWRGDLECSVDTALRSVLCRPSVTSATYRAGTTEPCLVRMSSIGPGRTNTVKRRQGLPAQSTR